MFDAARKPRWGLIDLAIVYAAGVLLTLMMGRALAYVIMDTMNLFIAAALVQFIIFTGLVLFFSLWVNKARPADLGIKKTSVCNLLVYGLLGGTFLMILMLLMGIPISSLQPDVEPQAFEQMLRTAGHHYQFFILLFLGMVTAPIAEELFYRGMVYPAVRSWLGPWWGAILAGSVFGLAHWDLWRTIPLAAGGALLCYFYEKTGSIWVTVLAHGTWNGLMSLMVYYRFLV